MNTLKQFKRIFTDFEFFQSDVLPCLSILAITEEGKSAADLQKLAAVEGKLAHDLPPA